MVTVGAEMVVSRNFHPTSWKYPPLVIQMEVKLGPAPSKMAENKGVSLG